MKISSPRHLLRRENLNLLVGEFGGATALATLCGTPKSHISALQAGNRGIGDDLAAKLERKTDKPVGWMDAKHTLPSMAHLDNLSGDVPPAVSRPERPLSEREKALLVDFDDLPEDEQDKLLADLHQTAERYRRYIREQAAKKRR